MTGVGRLPPKMNLGERLLVLFAVAVLAGGSAYDLHAFSSQATAMTTSSNSSSQGLSTTTASSQGLSTATSTAIVAGMTITSTSTDLYIGLLGCSLSTKICSLVAYSEYDSGNITISQDPSCIDLEWFPAPGIQSGTSSSSCTIAPSPILKFGQWAFVNATIDYYYIPQTRYGPPPVGSEVHGTLLVKHGAGDNWERATFTGVVTP